MSIESQLLEHYDATDLLAAIEEGLRALGISPRDVTVDELGPVDEFHMGGRAATTSLIEHLSLGEEHHLLDIGCGIGGTARLAASTSGCRVTGLDLVPDYVHVARTLTEWTGLDGRVDFEVGSALAMPFAAGSFDAATMLHVGMNIGDKAALFAQVRRVLRPGATLAVYDILRTSDGDITYPVPWATDESTSMLGDASTYRSALAEAGFDVVGVHDRRQAAIEFFAAMRARTQELGGPPPIGLHLIIGRSAPDKLANMVGALTAGTIAPTELICVAR